MQTTRATIKYILYTRKSSEAEDRQVESIESQINELKKLAKYFNIEIVEIIKESQSAKKTGRPGFNKMIKIIKDKQADGIICWKLDRLARNMIDGGEIMDSLQKGVIKKIITPERNYLPTDNVILMSVEFGSANQFCLDLSKNVKRGMKTKLDNGWRPGLAPPGYLNDMRYEQGRRTIIKDPKGFKLIQRAFKTILAGALSPNQVVDLLNDEWGYRTPKRRKMGGKPLAKSRFYKMLADPFYYGQYEFPKGSGRWYEGKHPPMITFKKFEQIQKILNRGNIPHPSTYRIEEDFYGIFRCAECDSALTPDRKIQTICSECKGKFSSKYKDTCPHCKTKISDMKNPTHLHYTYYKCSRKKNPDCKQTAIELKELKKQIIDVLGQLTISERMKDWYIKNLNKANEIQKDKRKDSQKALQEVYNDCQRRIDSLLDLKISPQNIDGSILSDEKFAEKNKELIKERESIKEKLTGVDAQNIVVPFVKTRKSV